MQVAEIEEKFTSFTEEREENVENNPAICAVRTLMVIIECYTGSTINGLVEELRRAVKVLEDFVKTGKYKLALTSACAQFLRFTTLHLGRIESEDFSSMTDLMLQEGKKYLKRCRNAGKKISKLGNQFVYDGARLMVHSHSKVVLQTLRAVPDNVFFTVYLVSDEDPGTLLDKSNIEYVKICDAEVATRMECVDLVFIGAEAVVKNGGIINRVGTLPMAICAMEMNKPLYVFAQSFKFSLLYPLSQSDVPVEFRVDLSNKIRVDYTPPKYITLLVTDRGLLTPVAVCDELIELYT